MEAEGGSELVVTFPRLASVTPSAAAAAATSARCCLVSSPPVAAVRFWTSSVRFWTAFNAFKSSAIVLCPHPVTSAIWRVDSPFAANSFAVALRSGRDVRPHADLILLVV